MKKLILFLLFLIPIIGYGQTSEISDSILIDTAYYNSGGILTTSEEQPILNVSADNLNVEVYGVEVVTIALLQAYEKECYNDSTVYMKHVGNSQQCYWIDYLMGDAPVCVNKEHHDIKAYKHREPTFKGFLEYIKKK
jgi:hypothetical protein